MSSGSNRVVYICDDNPEMVYKTLIDEDNKYIQDAEIEAYQNFGEEYEMFCPIDLENSSSDEIYMKRADVIRDCLDEKWREAEEDSDEQIIIDRLFDEWEGACIDRNRQSLERFYDLAKKTCELIYGEDEFDGEWLEEEFDKLLEETDGEKAFEHLFIDFHCGNYGFITGPEGKRRIVCVDYAGVW